MLSGKHLLQDSQEQQQAYNEDTSCSCEGEGRWPHEKQRLVAHVQGMPQLLASAAQRGRSIHLLKGTECSLDCSSARLI